MSAYLSRPLRTEATARAAVAHSRSSRMHKLETDLIIAVGDGSVDHSWPKMIVEYRYIPADNGIIRGERINPPEAEHVEIGSVYVVIETAPDVRPARHPLPEWQVEPMTAALEALCLDDWRGKMDDALERRAEERLDEYVTRRVNLNEGG